MIRDGVVIHEADLPHAPEKVWSALVDTDQIAVWLMPNDFVAVVGARFEMDCGPSQSPIRGEVLELEAPRRLVYSWEGDFGRTVVTFVLTPTPAGTHLRLEHREWPAGTESSRDHFDSGWPGKMGSLSVHLSTRWTSGPAQEEEEAPG
jgi:uncharacterized protein YndB with AHSA1/START domain